LDKVRFLLIGVGGIARGRHIPELLPIPEAEIVGLVDPVPASIAMARDRFPALADVPVFRHYREALKEISANAVVISTPHNEHLEQGVACIEAGLHVLMEKPFVVGSENAARLTALARERRLHLAVAYQRHVEPTYRYLHELVQSGALGAIQAITAYQSQRWLAATVGSWRQDPAISCGGQLNDSGSHLLDIILWTTGLQPESVAARIDYRGAPVDIDSSITIRFHGGALGSLAIIGSSSINWWEDVSINGDRGTALFRNGQILVARDGERDPAQVPAGDLPPWGTLVGNFVDLILGRITEPAAPAACGVAVARLTEAAWRSSEIGQPVML
jgi:predicted dehydrogenase